MIGKCPNLKELNLSSIHIDNQKITSERLNTILEKYPDLKKVILSKDTINSETLKKKFPKIKIVLR